MSLIFKRGTNVLTFLLKFMDTILCFIPSSEWIPFYLKQGSHKTIKNASSTYDLYRFGPIFESKMLQEHLIWSNEFLPRAQRAKVHFASLFSGGFITAIVVNPTESKLA